MITLVAKVNTTLHGPIKPGSVSPRIRRFIPIQDLDASDIVSGCMANTLVTEAIAEGDITEPGLYQVMFRGHANGEITDRRTWIYVVEVIMSLHVTNPQEG